MKLWAVDYWVPFPSSEYGGLEIWAARHKEELLQVMLTAVAQNCEHEYNREKYPAWPDLVRHAVDAAHEITVPAEAGFVDNFVT